VGAVAAWLVCWGDFAFPQSSPTYEKVLVPIFLQQPLPGAFGSLWATEFWISNGSDATVDFGGGFDFGCAFPPCGTTARLSPGVTFRPRVITRPDQLQGTFVLVASGQADRLAFGLRFRDLSRQSQTWGTEIPVARERDFRAEKLSMVDIPITSGFRQVLRLYDLVDNGHPRFARIRAYRIRPEHDLPTAPADEAVGESIAQFQVVSPGSPSAYPGYFAVFDLSSIALLEGVERLRLEIVPVTEGMRIWGFVTVVNNVTQYATVITPQ
jgi:hypothetical protein